jgi:hypothetical protein
MLDSTASSWFSFVIGGHVARALRFIWQSSQAKEADLIVSIKESEQYSDEEAKRRFEAALRGARKVGHEPMKDIPQKRATVHSAKSGKRKAKAGAKTRA